MNINELFDKLHEEGLANDLGGELIIKENCIIYYYESLNTDSMLIY